MDADKPEDDGVGSSETTNDAENNDVHVADLQLLDSKELQRQKLDAMQPETQQLRTLKPHILQPDNQHQGSLQPDSIQSDTQQPERPQTNSPQRETQQPERPLNYPQTETNEPEDITQTDNPQPIDGQPDSPQIEDPQPNCQLDVQPSILPAANPQTYDMHQSVQPPNIHEKENKIVGEEIIKAEHGDNEDEEHNVVDTDVSEPEQRLNATEDDELEGKVTERETEPEKERLDVRRREENLTKSSQSGTASKNVVSSSSRNRRKYSVFNKGSRPSICSPEFAIDALMIEEYEDASRLLQETNARLAVDVELAKHTTHKLSQAFNKRIKAAQERIEDLERELQITFDTAVHFETLYEALKLEEGTNKTTCAPQAPTTIPQPKEIDVKYLSLVEENKYIKEEMKKLKEENRLLKTRTHESFIDVQHHKKQLSVCHCDRELLQKKLHKQQQENKRLNQSMTKQASHWIHNKQQERKLDRERQFQRTISPVAPTGGQARWRSANVKNNDDKPRRIPVESWASENPLKSI